MRIKKEKINVFLVDGKPRQSRFTVDLLQSKSLYSEKIRENTKTNEAEFAEFLLTNDSESMIKARAAINQVCYRLQAREEVVVSNKVTWFDVVDDNLSGLAFYSLFKFIGKILFKFFYSVGLFFVVIFSYFVKFFKKIFNLILSFLEFFLVFFSSLFIRFIYLFGGKFEGSINKFSSSIGDEKVICKDVGGDEIVKQKFSWHKLIPELRISTAKNLIPFAVVLLFIILPFGFVVFYKSMSELRGKVLGESVSGVRELYDASKSASNLNFSDANKNFTEASDSFLKAQQELADVNSLMSVLSIVPSKDLKMAAQSEDILLAGRAAANLGNDLSIALSGLSSGEKNIKKILNTFIENGDKAVVDARILNEYVSKINPEYLPDEVRDKFSVLQSKSSELEVDLGEFVEIIKKLSSFLGTVQDKRYLLVFQNNSEARATGGFIGSYALIDFKDGMIKNIEVPGGGSYDTEAGLYERVIAPEPMHILNPLWHFWDANWWPDWSKSAKKLSWFYEKSNGPTVDGVISFTPDLIESVLKVIGPIDMTNDYGVVMTSDNFWQTTQTFAEQKPHVTKTPKKIIGDLMSKMMEELPKRMSKDVAIGLVSAVEESFNKKQVLLYFTDKELEEKVGEYGWDGKIKETPSDYLMVVNTNIGGGKSDRKIRQTIRHIADIASDGSVINEVKIIREHTGEKMDEFSGMRNNDYMRIYVPEGSQLLSATGFSFPDKSLFEKPDDSWTVDSDLENENRAQTETNSGTRIYNESGKTVFANWSHVDPGGTVEVTLRYRLPFTVLPKTVISEGGINKIKLFIKNLFGLSGNNFVSYSLLAQKQSGSNSSKFISQLISSPSYKLIKFWPNNNSEVTKWSVNEDLDSDKVWGAAFEIY